MGNNNKMLIIAKILDWFSIKTVISISHFFEKRLVLLITICAFLTFVIHAGIVTIIIFCKIREINYA